MSAPASKKPRAAAKPKIRATRSPQAVGGSTVRAAAREIASGVYRDAIVAAAQAEFTERGYAATKMVDVARRAGMSVGALYRHFDSKEAIFVSLIGVASERYLDRLVAREEALRGGDIAARLAALVATTLEFIEENRGVFLLFNQVGDSDRAACAALHDHVGSVRARSLAMYRRVLADGVAAGVLRRDVALDDQVNFLSGAMHGFIEAWMFDDGEHRLSDKAELIAHLTTRALGGPP